jgi:uncharacterized protein (TIGR02145 family)
MTVSIEEQQATRPIGISLTLTAILDPEGTSESIQWTSCDPTVATVKDGVVTTLSSGEVSIIASTEDGLSHDTCLFTVVTGCNGREPAFGEDLGDVRFKSDRVWKIGNQEWSDVVTASNCSNRHTYDGGSSGNYYADCRSNEGLGDLFSWCTVIRFQDEICPKGWRVPTENDFATLDMTLGGMGTGTGSYVDTVSRDQYANIWGGLYGGYCGANGERGGQDWGAYYWSQSERDANYAYRLNFHLDGYVFSRGYLTKDSGFMMRCIR